MGLSGEVREEDDAGGEGPVVHGFIERSKERYMDVGVTEPIRLSFRPWCVLCDAYTKVLESVLPARASRHCHVMC